MPPKEDKVPKKSKKKKLEEERLKREEELRISELAEEDRLEKERQEQEILERTRQANEARHRHEEAVRLNKEYGEHEKSRFERAELLKVEEAQVLKNEEWVKYMACDQLPDPLFENDLNTYLNQLRDDTQVDIDQNIVFVQQTETIIRNIQLWAARYEQKKNKERIQYCSDFITRLRALAMQKLDYMTAHILQHVDEYVNIKSELQKFAQTDDFKYGLWVRVAQNVRQKTIDYPDLGIFTDLPKPLALSHHNFAIRVLHCHQDCIEQLHVSDCLTLGGVFYVEILGMPAGAKIVKGWTLRPITNLATSVARLPYPIPPAGTEPGIAVGPAAGTGLGGQQQVPPMKVTFQIPENVWVRPDPPPRLGWWNDEHKNWDEDGISDVDFNAEKRSVAFHTLHLTALAVIQPRAQDIPYLWWSMRPVEESCASLTISGPYFSWLVEIEIRKGECTLVQPSFPELSDIRGVPMDPVALLRKLSKGGIYCFPVDELPEIDGVTPKNAEFERAVAYSIGLVAQGFSVSGSRWNQPRGADECVFRVAETLDYDNPPDPVSEEGWYTIVFTNDTPTRCHVCMATESAAEFNPAMEESLTTSSVLPICLAQKGHENALARCETAHVRFTHAVETMIELTRVLSYCDSVAYPTQHWFAPDPPLEDEEEEGAVAAEEAAEGSGATEAAQAEGGGAPASQTPEATEAAAAEGAAAAAAAGGASGEATAAAAAAAAPASATPTPAAEEGAAS